MSLVIVWSEFSWEAFATLATGLAAVAGATWVARGQMKIQKKQTEIQAATLRSDLFDRRFEVYTATAEFLVAMIRGSRTLPPAETEKFLEAASKSRFLFQPEVYEALDEIYLKACDLVDVAGNIANDQSRGIVNAQDTYKMNLISRWFNEKITSYHDIFSELHLENWQNRPPIS